MLFLIPFYKQVSMFNKYSEVVKYNMSLICTEIGSKLLCNVTDLHIFLMDKDFNFIILNEINNTTK